MARDELVKIEGEARSAERIRSDLARARHELAASVADLKVEVAKKVSAREWYRSHTGLFVLGAFTVGFWLGMRKRS